MSHTSDNAQILKTQQEGYEAFLKGVHPRDCPHKSDSPENKTKQEAWIRGYAASRTDRARANKQAT